VRKDGFQIAGQLHLFVVAQTEASENGYVVDVIGRECHRARPLSPSTERPSHDAMLWMAPARDRDDARRFRDLDGLNGVVKTEVTR
jgi:hypothetical protein